MAVKPCGTKKCKTPFFFSGKFNANHHHLLLSPEFIFHLTITPIPEGSIKYWVSVMTSYKYIL